MRKQDSFPETRARLRRIVGLGYRHFGFLIFCLWLVLAIRVALTVSTYRSINRHIRVRDRADAAGRSPHLIVWGVVHASRLVPKASCLTRALAVQYLMAKSGHDSIIRVGVASTPDGRVEAHAWVLQGETVLIGGSEEGITRFKPIVDLPARP